MKTDHRVLLWCVAAWMCCIVVNCRVEFFDGDGKALREEDILDNDWYLKDDRDKISDDSYRRKAYVFQNAEIGETETEIDETKETCECGEDSSGCSFDKDGKKTCECNIGFAQKGDTCIACECGSDSSGCSFDKDEKKTCECNTNFAQKGDTCTACECGSDSSGCSFDKDEKKTCECNKNFAQKGDTCTACACGGDSIGCSFDTDGKKTCECNTDFAQKGDTCIACGCGEDSTGCSFDKDEEKTCKCNNNFAQKGDICTACACGGDSKGCSFDKEGEKTCECNKDFAQKGDTCIACECGGDSSGCSFDKEGKKTCECNKNFAQKGDICIACACGDGSSGCSFNEKGEKSCICGTGFAQNGGTCEACTCGKDSSGCSFNAKGEKLCTCNAGFAQKNGTCEACDCGPNSKNCSFGDAGEIKCTCKPKYAQKGNRCAEEACVVECGNKDDVECRITEERIECECKEPGKKFDTYVGECRRPCELESDCENQAPCEEVGAVKFCDCPEGITGDTCGYITDCITGKYARCKGTSLNGKCQYDHENQRAVCNCPPGRKLKDISGYCGKCNCGKNSSDCSYVNDKITCNCNTGYAQRETTCEECNCGKNSVSCSFQNRRKTCICEEGFGDNNGICQKCSGGDNVRNCSFENGKETFICKDGFALKNGTCAECNCGGHSTECRFENLNKVCVCKDGYAVDDGICRGCNCGDNSTSCRYVNGYKRCTCKEDNAADYGKCKYCVCGENTKACRFEKSQKRCDCLDKYSLKDEKCTDCECGDHSTGCTFKKDNTKECHCEKGYADKDGNCIEDKCVTKCGVPAQNPGDIRCVGDWSGDINKINCNCFKDTLQFDSKKKECRETCDGEKRPCQNGAACEENGKQFFCNCLNNTAGYHCEVITECEKGNKFEKCKGDRGKCVYNVSQRKAICECNEKTVYDENEKYCQSKCTKNTDCPNGKICFDRLYCTCEKGKTGDNCEIVTGCNDELKAKCKTAGAECAFSQSPPNFAACVCKDRNLEFIEQDTKCVAKFCKDVGCKNGATCEFDSDTGTAYCKCPSGKYYNYKTEICSEPDKCLLRKDPCKENYVCREGKCECDGDMQDDKCIRKVFCKDGACFPGAKCDNDTATCKCDDDHYFTGSSCKAVKCIKDPFHADCSCPAGTTENKETKKCEVPKDKECKKDCGLGYCSGEECICIDGVSKLHEGKCVLDENKVCASKKLNKDLKTCECTGIYKQADDKITCKLVTCAEVQECKHKGASCKMAWTGDSIGYSCECPTGYVYNEDKEICTDPCSVYDNVLGCAENDKVCYNSHPGPDNKPFTCDCAPPFKTTTKTCDDVSEYTYLISDIPVLKKRYQMEKAIDYVKLNNDLMESLSQMYDKNIFNSGYLHDYVEDGDVLKTSVWVRFNQTISGQLRRFSWQAQKFPNTTCEECDTNLYIWPPHVVLKGSDFKDVKAQSLSVCARALKNNLCGEEAECKDNKCSCPRGFKTLEFTIKNIGQKARLLRCEKTVVADVDECALNTHTCTDNTTCIKKPGGYICQCKPGYRKLNENDCVDLCTPSPCAKGSCSMKKERFNCKCQAGYGGSYCDEADVNFAAAKKSTVVVGAVLGTILIVGVLGALFFYIKKRKSSYSEDFMPAPRQDLASEMRERRPIRGVVNTSYE